MRDKALPLVCYILGSLSFLVGLGRLGSTCFLVGSAYALYVVVRGRE